MAIDNNFDKNVTMNAEEYNIPLEVEWDDFIFYRDMALVIQFPRNVNMVVADRTDDEGHHRVFRLTYGDEDMYMYYFVDADRSERYMYISRRLYLDAHGFDYEHVNPEYWHPRNDPVFDHPIFELTDE